MRLNLNGHIVLQALSGLLVAQLITPTLGWKFFLSYSVTGAENHITTYNWKKDSTSLSNEVEPTLSFSHLRLSCGGQYTCIVTVNNSIIKYSYKDIIPTVKWN